MSAPRSPSGEREARSAPWLLVAVVVGPLAVRLAAAATIHLTEDESYYRLWSFAPALGYYDHPPMIAWWIAMGRSLVGDDALGVRLLPILASGLTTLLVFDLARLAGAGERTATWAAVFFSATILAALGAILAVPDAPASLFWTVTLWCALKARTARRPISWWLAAGAAAGLACLSKYSALFLAPGMGLWLISSRGGRAELRQPGPWLAAATALAFFALNVGWNAQHHWPTFARQFGRVGAGGFSAAHLPEFLAGQFLLLNPPIAIFAVRALGSRNIRRSSATDLAPFVAASAPFAVYLLIHSLHARVEAHWPAPIYPAIAVIAAVGASDARAGWARLRAAAPILGFALAAAVLAWLAMPAGDLAPPFDPALPIRGWKAFAASLEEQRRGSGAAWIGTTSYGLTAQLAGERQLRAPVVEIYERARWRALRQTPAPDLTRPGLIVDLPRRIDPARLRRCFAQVRPAGIARRGDGGGPWTIYGEVLVSRPKADVLAAGCPTP